MGRDDALLDAVEAELLDPKQFLDGHAGTETVVLGVVGLRRGFLAPGDTHGLGAAEEDRAHVAGAVALSVEAAKTAVAGLADGVDLGNLAVDDAIIDDVTILEERVLLEAIALAGTGVLVGGDDGGVTLDVPERPRTVEGDVELAAIFGHVGADVRVGGLGDALGQRHGGRGAAVVRGVDIAQRRGVGGRVVGHQLAEQNAVRVGDNPGVLGRGVSDGPVRNGRARAANLQHGLGDVVAHLLGFPHLQGGAGGVEEVDLGLERRRLRHADAVTAPVDGDAAVVVAEFFFGAVEGGRAGDAGALQSRDQRDVDRLAGFFLKLVLDDDNIVIALAHIGLVAGQTNVLAEVRVDPLLLFRSSGEGRFGHLRPPVT